MLVARIADRIGKGIRDAPRDALLADVTPSAIRGAGFGLRPALYTVGAVVGPLAAIALMTLSGDNFSLVFWIALLPGFASIVVLLVGVKEAANHDRTSEGGSVAMTSRCCGALLVGNLDRGHFLVGAVQPGVPGAESARCSRRCGIRADHTGDHVLDYSAAAYPFGVLADGVNRHLQLGIGAVILVGADLALASADTVWMTALGAALWGLQMGVTQGLLSAAIADAAPERVRGTAFGIFDLAVGPAPSSQAPAPARCGRSAAPPVTFVAGAALAAVVICPSARAGAEAID